MKIIKIIKLIPLRKFVLLFGNTETSLATCLVSIIDNVIDGKGFSFTKNRFYRLLGDSSKDSRYMLVVFELSGRLNKMEGLKLPRSLQKPLNIELQVLVDLDSSDESKFVKDFGNSFYDSFNLNHNFKLNPLDSYYITRCALKFELLAPNFKPSNHIP